MNATESISSSAVKTSRDVGAKVDFSIDQYDSFKILPQAIIVLTESGRTACCIAKYRPSIPVLAITHFPDVARQIQGYMRVI